MIPSRASRVFTALAVLAVSCGAAKPPGAGEAGAESDPGERGGRDEGDAPVAAAAGSAGASSIAVPDETKEERAAARALFESINAERVASGLSKLAWSGELAAVGRAYCAEMARTGEIAHDSELSGRPSDRAERAGIPFVRLTENLALAEDAAAAHDGLMHSPGHRANILDDQVTVVGVGALYTVRDGVRSLLVTQMFALPPERIDSNRADDELVSRLNESRRALDLPTLSRHKWLDGRAKKMLGACASGAISEPAEKEKNPPFHFVTAVLVRGGAISQIAGGLSENERLRSELITHLGVAVTRVDGSGSGICAVVLVGSKE